jgi:hypothetical protein
MVKVSHDDTGDGDDKDAMVTPCVSCLVDLSKLIYLWACLVLQEPRGNI